MAGGVGPARLRALVPAAPRPARPLLSPPPPPPPARPPLPPSRPACLPRSLAPSLRSLSRSLSPPPPRVPPPTPSLRLPPSLPPAARGLRPSARCSPPRPRGPAPALRNRPASQRRLGGPGAPRPGAAWRRAAGPSALGPTSRPLRPGSGVPARCGSESWTPQRPDRAQGPGTRLGRSPGHSAGDCGGPHPATTATLRGAPATWRCLCAGSPHPALAAGQRPLLSAAGVQIFPGSPAEPPAAFALQFSRPPPEPTALCLLSTGAGDSSASYPRATTRPP